MALARYFRRTGQIVLVATLSLALLAGAMGLAGKSSGQYVSGACGEVFQQAFPQAALAGSFCFSCVVRLIKHVARRGQLAEDDFLRLLSPADKCAGKRSGPPLGEMQYVDGRLQVMGKGSIPRRWHDLRSSSAARLATGAGAVPGSFNTGGEIDDELPVLRIRQSLIKLWQQ